MASMRRRTTKRRTSSKRVRKGSSHCSGIGRATCRRTAGCKYANGMKRTFCRTSKNSKKGRALVMA